MAVVALLEGGEAGLCADERDDLPVHHELLGRVGGQRGPTAGKRASSDSALRDSRRAWPPPFIAMQRMPSSLRS